MIDKLLTQEINKQVWGNDVAVLLSGGVDSISVAFAAMNARKKITAYSFHLDTEVSYDFLKAKVNIIGEYLEVVEEAQLARENTHMLAGYISSASDIGRWVSDF